VPPNKDITAIINLPRNEDDLAAAISNHQNYFDKLARVSQLTVGSDIEKPPASASIVVGRNAVYIPLSGIIDLDVERERLMKSMEQTNSFLGTVQRKLRNPQFITKAPPEVVARERQKESDALGELNRIRENLSDLQ